MGDMLSTLKSAWRNEDLHKRLLFTMFMIVLFRVGGSIPVPGIDRVAFTNIINRFGTLGSMMDLISGGALTSVSIFAMGIQPYINSSIIIQLLTVAIPALERMSQEGETGRKKIQNIVRIFTVVLGLFQSFAFWYATNSATVSTLPKWLTCLVVVGTFTAGTAVVMWIGELINMKGIGNGISILIFAGIIARLPHMLLSGAAYFNIWLEQSNIILAVLYVLVIIVVALALLALITYINIAERRIPVQYAKRVIGRKMMGGQSTYLPIRVNQSSVMPVIFAMSIIQIPSLISSFAFINSDGPIVSWFRNLDSNPIQYVFHVLLIIGFTFFYSSIQYNPTEISNNLQKNGGFIPGIRPGRPTTEFIRNSANRLNWFEGVFLSFVTIFPMFIGAVTKTNGLWFGGTAIIIIVGVCMDTITQIQSQMSSRKLKTFLD